MKEAAQCPRCPGGGFTYSGQDGPTCLYCGWVGYEVPEWLTAALALPKERRRRGPSRRGARL